MKSKEAEELFKKMSVQLFFEVYQLTNEDRLFFKQFVEGFNSDEFDGERTLKTAILHTINLFNNNPEDFKQRAEVLQLKLL